MHSLCCTLCSSKMTMEQYSDLIVQIRCYEVKGKKCVLLAKSVSNRLFHDKEVFIIYGRGRGRGEIEWGGVGWGAHILWLTVFPRLDTWASISRSCIACPSSKGAEAST